MQQRRWQRDSFDANRSRRSLIKRPRRFILLDWLPPLSPSPLPLSLSLYFRHFPLFHLPDLPWQSPPLLPFNASQFTEAETQRYKYKREEDRFRFLRVHDAGPMRSLTQSASRQPCKLHPGTGSQLWWPGPLTVYNAIRKRLSSSTLLSFFISLPPSPSLSSLQSFSATSSPFFDKLLLTRDNVFAKLGWLAFSTSSVAQPRFKQMSAFPRIREEEVEKNVSLARVRYARTSSRVLKEHALLCALLRTPLFWTANTGFRSFFLSFFLSFTSGCRSLSL